MTIAPIEPRFGAGAADDDLDDASGDAVVWEVRKRNLMWLRARFQDEAQRQDPSLGDRGMDRRFAEAVGMPPKYFGHIKAGRRNVGNSLARQVERSTAMPVGWLDHAHEEASARDAEERDTLSAFVSLLHSDPEVARQVLVRGFDEVNRRRMAETKGKKRSGGADGEGRS